MGKTKTQFSSEKIFMSLDILIDKIARLSLSAEIIRPIASGRINGKLYVINKRTIPLLIILEDASKFITGRLTRCYFDIQDKDNNTASFHILFDQIFNNTKDNGIIKSTHAQQFKNINEKLIYANQYKKKLNTFCRKYYAHSDIRSLETVEEDTIKLNVPFDELFMLIDNAKDILRDMCIACDKSIPDF